MKVSVIIPTHAPHLGRLQRMLAGLRAQTLPPTTWETILVDNASPQPMDAAALQQFAPVNLTVSREPVLGLTSARLHGIRRARGELIVFVDDDNILAPGFLEHAVHLFADHSRLGAAGGPITAEFEVSPPAWAREFFGLLALRDLGGAALIATGGAHAPWPACAPVGAGLCLRRTAVELYVKALTAQPTRLGLDRAGRSLASGGDNDLVFTVLHGGWDVGYFPELALTHLIPASRLEADYFARLNEGIMRTWVRVLQLHGQCPWPAIPRWTLPARIARSWWRAQPWRSPAHRIRWRGIVGQFQGQADLNAS